MEPRATSNLFPLSSFTEMNLFPGTSSYSDPDVIEVASSSSWRSNNQKRKRNQVIPHDIIEIDEDDDLDGVVFLGETLPNHKHKPPAGLPIHNGVPMASEPSMNWLMHINGPFGHFAGSSSSTINPTLPGKTTPVQASTSTLLDFDFADYEYFKDDDFFEEDYDDFKYENIVMDTDPSFSLEAKLDGLNIPTAAKASVPSLQKCFGSGSGSSSGSTFKQPKVVNDELDINYRAFKQFDTVRDYTDHYYFKQPGSKFKSSLKPTKEWTRRIQNDWKLLEKDLPESIFVRVYEDRMDLLRAVIIGPLGTPYHDGLFFFDVYFPPTFPNVPPMVYYHSGGLRLNPNLYACGKVCLSLLNTWHGRDCEMWNPANSTMLQVLVSIQALVLNSKPYFNEPGYAAHANTPYGEQKSLIYNEDTFLLSCKTMLYSLRRPPKHFEHFVAGHFRTRGNVILVACSAYMEGVQVGCLAGDGVQDVDEGDKSSSENFKNSLKRIFEDLLMEFTVKGADCDEFLAK